MTTLWIIIGCLFMTAIGIRFIYKYLALTKKEAVSMYFIVLLLVVVNSAPVRELLAGLF